MKWFLDFCWSYISTIKSWISGALRRSETSTDVPTLQEKLKEQATSILKETNTIAEAKSKLIANQSSSRKKPSSGTKRKKK